MLENNSQSIAKSPSESSSKPVQLTEQNFEKLVIESNEPYVLDFWAPWCGPCRAIAPVLEKLAAEYAGKIKVGKVNVDEEIMLAGAFKVQSIPTVVAIQGREVLDLQLGFGGEARLRKLFETLAASKPQAERQGEN